MKKYKYLFIIIVVTVLLIILYFMINNSKSLKETYSLLNQNSLQLNNKNSLDLKKKDFIQMAGVIPSMIIVTVKAENNFYYLDKENHNSIMIYKRINNESLLIHNPISSNKTIKNLALEGDWVDGKLCGKALRL